MSLEIDTACRAAVLHTLKTLRNDPRKFWLMGDGTEVYEKLTAAAALIYGDSQENVKVAFRPRKEDYDNYCAEQLVAKERKEAA